MDRVVASFDSCGHRRERKRRKEKKREKRGSDRFAAVVVSERMEKKGEAGRDEGKRMTSFRGS